MALPPTQNCKIRVVGKVNEFVCWLVSWKRAEDVPLPLETKALSYQEEDLLARCVFVFAALVSTIKI